MELKEGQRELYYTFDNEFADSDIVVNLKAAKQYTTRLYFYESYENIKVNSQDEFEGFIEELDLSEKFAQEGITNLMEDLRKKRKEIVNSKIPNENLKNEKK